eukprot:764231-Hanusia_phi.AAC.4
MGRRVSTSWTSSANCNVDYQEVIPVCTLLVVITPSAGSKGLDMNDVAMIKSSVASVQAERPVVPSLPAEPRGVGKRDSGRREEGVSGPSGPGPSLFLPQTSLQPLQPAVPPLSAGWRRIEQEEVAEKQEAANVSAEAAEGSAESGPRVRMFEIVGWEDGEESVDFEVKQRGYEGEGLSEAWQELENFDSDDLWTSKVRTGCCLRIFDGVQGVFPPAG